MDENKTETPEQEVPEQDAPATPDVPSTSTPEEQPAESSLEDSSEETPVDALSRTPEDLAEEQAASQTEETTPEPIKKTSAFKRFFKKVNVYFLFFSLLIVVAGAITIVNYLNNQKANPTIDIATQELADKTLEQLANTDVSVGNNNQTLTIQGNAIITGQTLMRGSTNVAGNLQTGGTIQGPSITISGAVNLGQTQTQTLQVQNTLAVQGSSTLRDLTVSGASTFSGNVTANQITATRLILSGNATLEVPNHIGFTGPTPSRSSIEYATLGSGGTLSLSGSDSAGVINIQTGNNPQVGCFGRFTFSQAFTRQPRVIVSPVEAAAGKLDFYTTRDQRGFSICTANIAQANATFSFDYFISN